MRSGQQGELPEIQREPYFSAAWAALVLVCLALAPWAVSVARWVPPCLFKTWTTLPCPLCGTTRAALALARLDPLHGLAYFPLPTLFWIMFLVGGALAGIGVLLSYPLPRPRRMPRGMAIGLVVALLTNWVYSVVTGV